MLSSRSGTEYCACDGVGIVDATPDSAVKLSRAQRPRGGDSIFTIRAAEHL